MKREKLTAIIENIVHKGIDLAPYRTATTKGSRDTNFRELLESLDFIEFDGNILIRCSVENLPLEYAKKADVVYTELAWTPGFKFFHSEAESEPTLTHKEYVIQSDLLVKKIGIPGYVVCQPSVVKYMKNAENVQDIELTAHKYVTKIVLYNGAYTIEKSTKSLIKSLATQHKCALDFSCGYGTSLLNFRNFVGADIDGKCLDYIRVYTEIKNRKGV